MSNESMGRSSRMAPPPAPSSSGIALVVTAVALVLGFLILRQVNSSPDTSTPAADDTTSTSLSPSGSSLNESTTSTTQPLVYTGTKVVVANCSSLNGVAGQLSLALGGLGFSMTDAFNGTIKLTTSKVVYNPDDPAALPVANSVARILGGIVVEPASLPLMAGDGTWPAGTAVLVMLGSDYAGKSISEIQANPSALPVAVETTTTTTPAVATSAP